MVGSIQSEIGPAERLSSEIDYLVELCPVAGDMAADIDRECVRVEAELEAMTFDPDADKAAYLTIKAGSGGHEACAWAQMLLRMYGKYARRKGLETTLMDVVNYEPDGIRSVVVRIEGRRAFALFRGEAGIHRLSRVSPYDQADRRQTSRASVEVEPEADARASLADQDLLHEDVEVTTCCGGGPGGQKINKTEIVAQVKHLPTGIQVRCQAGRSQTDNKRLALELLKAKVFALEQRKRDEEAAKKRAAAPKAAWGFRSRTYVLSQHPGVQDHRSGKKVADVEAVLEGDLDLLS